MAFLIIAALLFAFGFYQLGKSLSWWGGEKNALDGFKWPEYDQETKDLLDRNYQEHLDRVEELEKEARRPIYDTKGNELMRYEVLRRHGVITQAEFENLKERIIND